MQCSKTEGKGISKVGEKSLLEEGRDQISQNFNPLLLLLSSVVMEPWAQNARKSSKKFRDRPNIYMENEEIIISNIHSEHTVQKTPAIKMKA